MFEANRSIEELDPSFRPKVRRFIQRCKLAHLNFCIIETKRSLARQCWLYGKGRFLRGDWEKKYLGYDDPNIGCEPKAARVTWTLSSNHLKGLAFDFVPMRNGNAWWSAPDAVWELFYLIAEDCGMVSMYRKHRIDRPHISSDGN